MGGPHFEWLSGDIRRALSSKTSFASWVDENKIPFPRSLVCHSVSDGEKWMRAHGCRCVMKANHLGSGKGVRCVETDGVVEEVWNELGRPAEFLLQQFVTGCKGVTEMVANKGHLLAWFSSLKARTGTPLGPSVARSFYLPAQMKELATEVTRKLGFHGLCGFDWIEDQQTGEVKIMEFHPRPPSGFWWGQYWGIDTVKAVNSLLHQRFEPVQAPQPNRAANSTDDCYPICCYFPEHLLYAVKKRPSDLRFWLPFSNSIAWRNALFFDPSVMAAAILRKLWPTH
jgi:hypothetical protein